MVGASTDRIYIQRDDDWSRMRGQGLTTVVDPLVFRTGDVFLRGQKRITATDPGKDTEAVWKALEANIGSLATFFDLLVLQPQIPIFDYRVDVPSLEHGELARTCRADRYVQPGRRTRADPSQRRS